VSDPIAFIFCTEPGILEKKSVLFARSLRRFGGRLAAAPLHSFQPRDATPLSSGTRRTFRDLGVTHDTTELNRDFKHYGIGNKIFAAAHAEATIDASVLVFVDSDLLVLREPHELLLAPEKAAGVRPVDIKLAGSAGPGDDNEGYWRQLYEICGVPDGYFVTTTVTGERIRAYWNAGIVAVRRSRGIFSAWENNFLKVAGAGLSYLPNRLLFEDQTSLAATLCSQVPAQEITTFSSGYNYPVHLYAKRDGPTPGIGDVAMAHYHHLLERFRWARMLSAGGLDEEHVAWLRRHSPFGFSDRARAVFSRLRP
jgi:hypothetical protein